MRPEGFVSGNPDDSIGNRTRDVPACSPLVFYAFEKECKLNGLVSMHIC